MRKRARVIDRLAWTLLGIFALDRLLKLAAVEHFFRRPAPKVPARWPSVAILQPITRGASALRENLRCRALLDYPAPITHFWICDAADEESQAACHATLENFPDLDARIVLAGHRQGGVEGKIRKLQVALPLVESEVVVFMDDDVAPRPDALRRLLPYLDQPATGAVFGLPCYVSWYNVWSGLMSLFVNANMPLSFVGLTYLADPFRIVGHITAFRRDIFQRAGGLDGLEQHIDDDFEIARRLRAQGLRSVQTPLVYDIDNDLPSARAFNKQLARWFVLPGQSMLPSLSPWQRCVTLLASGPSLVIPGIMAALTLLTRRKAAGMALAASLGLFGAGFALCEARYLGKRMPLRCWLLLPIVAIITPLQATGTLLARGEVEWRGQRLKIRRDGRYEVLP